MKCALIYNPNSGRAKQERSKDYVVKKLRMKFEEVDVYPTQYPKHATILASEACGKYDTLVVIGGDGTLNEVINGIAEKNNAPTLAYIPHGTVNDVGHSLKIPRHIKGAVKVILSGKTYMHDIFKVNDKYGIYVCCAGLFTETSYATEQRHKKRAGKLAYFFHGLKKVFTTDSMDMKVLFEGGELKGKFAFMLVLNSRNVAGFGINRKAKLDDGKLDILLIPENRKIVSLKGIAKVFSLFVLGFKRQGYRLRLSNFSVETSACQTINIDGEKAFNGGFNLEVIRQGVKIIVPQKFKK